MNHIAGQSAEKLVLDNAMRLLDDARMLRKGRRYASATALAVLSLEELGKFIIAENLFAASPSLGKSKSQLRAHAAKQHAAAKALVGSMGIDEVLTLMAARGYTMVLRRIEKHQSEEKEERVTVESVIASIKDDEYDRKLATVLRNARQNKFIVWLVRGEFDKIKQKAFYIDIGPNGRALSLPSAINRDTADRIIRLASRAISTVKLELPREARRRARAAMPRA